MISLVLNILAYCSWQEGICVVPKFLVHLAQERLLFGLALQQRSRCAWDAVQTTINKTHYSASPLGVQFPPGPHRYLWGTQKYKYGAATSLPFQQFRRIIRLTFAK